MYLERLEIAGFKSFANKTILEFPRPNADTYGIASIVGPNGSGKSNILESIRWGLGEQSSKILRIKKAEDIIFSGSDNKGRLSSAEVSLAFNNEDGGAPIDYRQFVVTRKIYRQGESDYFINKNRARLQDILILLAQSNFGQKSYSIIGQGTIDMILHSSPTERRNYFDEATGVRQYQIKKDEALRKLEKTEENLQQAEVALQEIEPRMRSLTRQIKKLERRQQFEEQLHLLQKKYYGGLWHRISQSTGSFENQIKELEDKNNILQNELQQLQKQLESMAYEKISDDYQKIQTEQQKLINLKNEYLEKVTILRGELVVEKQKLAQNKKGPSLNPQKILFSLKEIKRFSTQFIDELNQVNSLSDIEALKKKFLAVDEQISQLIQVISGEKNETSSSPLVEKITQEVQAIDQEIQKLSEKIGVLSRDLSDFANKEQEKRKSLFDLQKKIQNKQMEFHAVNNELNSLKIEKARVETRKEDLEKEFQQETSLANLAELAKGVTLTEENLEKVFSEMQSLKHQLDLIGGIDPEISKEYPECKERWEFLTTHTQDLRSALQSLNKVIKQLDEKIEAQFSQTFHKINEKFDYYFKVFFSGGRAKLVLQKTFLEDAKITANPAGGLVAQVTDAPEIENDQPKGKNTIDIEIVANPPGKKLKNIEALSGGERTLTSLALICAIIAINKPPFVVLDEVDAALDEENSSRFANIIKDLAHFTQFIVITHNRQTMEAANNLYGVTMGKDSVSKLLSMKL